MKADHISAVARLHCETLQGTLSNLGYPVVRQYYQAALGCSWLIARVAVRDRKVIGMVFGSTEPSRVWRDIFTRGKFGLGAALAGSLLSNPGSISQLLGSMRVEPCRTTHTAELIYIAVDPAARGQKVGDALMNAFAAEVTQRGFKGYYLFVLKDNPTAQRLYAKHGLHIVQHFALNGVENLCMETGE